MTAEQLPIFVKNTKGTHTEPKEKVHCPKSGKLVNVAKCTICADLRIILPKMVKCLHNPKKNAGEFVMTLNV